MTKLLAVVTLREPILCFVCLYLDCDVAEAVQTKTFFGFDSSGEGDKK
jgi:hypothetical protein